MSNLIYDNDDFELMLEDNVAKFRADQARNRMGQFAPEGGGGSSTVSGVPAGVNLDKPTYTEADLQGLHDARRKYDEVEWAVKEEIKAANPQIKEMRPIWDKTLADPRVIAAQEEYMSNPMLQRIRGFKSRYEGVNTLGEHADQPRDIVVDGERQENPLYEHSPAGREIARLYEYRDFYEGDPKDRPVDGAWSIDDPEARAAANAAYAAGYKPMTRAESFNAATQAVNEFLGESSPAIRINSTKLGSVISDGRLKTSFETGKRLPSAGLMYTGYLDKRAAVENLWYGYDDNTPDADRPVYGFIRANNGNNSKYLQGYGDSEIILKPSILDRTTLSFGDSLNRFAQVTPFKAGSTINPNYRNDNEIGQTAAAYKAGTGTNYFSHPASTSDMLEAQYHGGVKLSDIDKIIIHRSDVPQTLLNRLDKAGITYEVRPTEPPLPKDD